VQVIVGAVTCSTQENGRSITPILKNSEMAGISRREEER